MKSKLIGLVVVGVVAVTIIATVGGWLDNYSGGKENPGNQGGSAPIVETGVEVMPLTEFNTDTPFENLTMEIVEYSGEQMVYKITNNSDVCYKKIGGSTYFKCDPLPNHQPLREGQEYYNNFSFYNIPAYSETYHIHYSFLLPQSNSKSDSEWWYAYYPFEFGVDPYRIEIDDVDGFIGSEVSEELIQDASEFVTFEKSYDSEKNLLGKVTNKSAHNIQIDGYVKFANGYLTKITGYTGVAGRVKVPEYGKVIKKNDFVCGLDGCDKYVDGDCVSPCVEQEVAIDTNSIYTYPEDFENDVMDYEVVIGNAYFIGEVDWENE